MCDTRWYGQHHCVSVSGLGIQGVKYWNLVVTAVQGAPKKWWQVMSPSTSHRKAI